MDDILNWIGLIVMGISGIAIIVVLMFGIKTGIKDYKEKKDQKTEETVELYNINILTEPNGDFFLGCGNINGVQYYTAYKKADNGGYELYKMRTDRTVIYPELEKNETAYAIITKNGFDTIKEIKLYVPRNMVYKEYN